MWAGTQKLSRHEEQHVQIIINSIYGAYYGLDTSQTLSQLIIIVIQEVDVNAYYLQKLRDLK